MLLLKTMQSSFNKFDFQKIGSKTVPNETFRQSRDHGLWYTGQSLAGSQSVHLN